MKLDPKSLLGLASAAVLLLSGTTAAVAAPASGPPDYYVAVDGNDAWSGTLAEPNPAGTDGPFATIGAARDAVRAGIAGGMTADVVVEVGGGDYYTSQPITFGTADSGRDGFEVIYRAAEDEEPVIHGGRLVTGWTAGPGGTYTATVATPLTRPGALVEDGERGVPARFPNEGYSLTHAAVAAAPATSFEYSAGDVPAVADPTTLQTVIWAAGDNGIAEYSRNILNVTAVDTTARTVTTGSPAIYPIGPNSHYFVQGAPELLDVPGEFSYDAATGTLTYLPRQTPVTDVVLPETVRVLELVGASDSAPVENLRFDGLTVADSAAPEEVLGQGSGDAAIYLTNARAVTFENGRIRNSGTQGLLATGWAQQLTVSGNLVTEAADTCVGLFGPSPTIGRTTSNYVNKDHVVTNNLIEGCGRVSGYGVGIYLWQSGGNEVTHNRVVDTARWGIGMMGAVFPMLYFGQHADGVDVTKDNWQEVAYLRDNHVAYNELARNVTEGFDAGAIDTCSTGEGNVVANNLIHSAERSPYWFGSNLHAGIYSDAYSDDMTFEHNLLVDVSSGGGANWVPLFQEGLGTSHVNNIVADNSPTAAAFTTLNYAQPTWLGTSTLDDFRHNVISQSGGTVYEAQGGGWDAGRVKVADLNLFWNDGDPVEVAGEPLLWLGYRGTLDEWRDLGYARYDRRSEVADPEFVDPAGLDYRFGPDSPAHALGSTDVDRAAIGLTADFAIPAGAADPLDRVDAVTPGGAAVVQVDSAGPAAELPVVVRTESGRVLDPADVDVSYDSADPGVATVAPDGTVTAVAPGLAEVTITAERGGDDDTTTVWLAVDDPVDALVARVPGTTADTTVDVGATRAVEVVAEHDSGRFGPIDPALLTYGSSAPGVATVDAAGRVTGVSAGTTVVTASATVGGTTVTGTVTVRVRTGYLDTTALVLLDQQLAEGATSAGVLTGTLQDGTPANLSGATIGYTSADPAVATVDAAGTVTAVAEGRTKIVATTTLGGVTRRATALVTVAPAGGDDVASGWHVQRTGGVEGYATGDGADFRFVSTGSFGADAYQFVHQSRLLTTPATSIQATVARFDDVGQNSGIGLMYRSSTSASPAPAFVAVVMSPEGRTFLTGRAVDGGPQLFFGNVDAGATGRLRLVRDGDLYTGQVWHDGQWTEVAHLEVALGLTVDAGIVNRAFDPYAPIAADLTGVAITGGTVLP